MNFSFYFGPKIVTLVLHIASIQNTVLIKKGTLLRIGFKISSRKIDNDMTKIVSNCKMFIMHFMVTLKDVLIIIKCRSLDEEASLLGKDLERV